MTDTAWHNFFVAGLIFLGELCLGLIGASLPFRLFLGCMVIFFLWKGCTEQDGSASPIGFYLFASSIYVFAALAEVGLASNRMGLDPILMGDLADMGVAFLIAAAAGYLICIRGILPPLGSNVAIRVTASSVRAALLLCAGLLFISVMFTASIYGLGIGTLSRFEIYADSSGLLTFVRGLLSACLGMTAALLVSHEVRQRRVDINSRVQLFVLLFIYVMIDLLVLGDRRLPLVAMLGVGLYFARFRFSWAQIGAGAALAVTLFLYGFVRNTPPSQWLGVITSGAIFDVVSPASTEFGGLAIIGQAIGNFHNKVFEFPTYSTAFLQVLPRFLIENRPLSPTEWFMDTFYPRLAAAGASYAFNQVIEARLNAGWFGVLFAGMTTGMTIGALSRVRLLGAPVGFALATYIFTFSMRMDFASILKTGLVAAFGFSLLWLATMAVSIPKAAMAPRGAP